MSANKTLTIAVKANHSAASHHPDSGQDHQRNLVDILCHATGDCTIHSCGGGGITSSFSSINAVAAICYSGIVHSSLYSTSFSPEIRPPILIL